MQAADSSEINLRLKLAYLPRFLLAFRLGRSFSAPLPLLCRPRPRFPAEVLPRYTRPLWALLPLAEQKTPSCLSLMIAGW